MAENECFYDSTMTMPLYYTDMSEPAIKIMKVIIAFSKIVLLS